MRNKQRVATIGPTGLLRTGPEPHQARHRVDNASKECAEGGELQPQGQRSQLFGECLTPHPQRGRKVFMSLHRQYEAEKARWLRVNPGATPEQTEEAFKQIARELGI